MARDVPIWVTGRAAGFYPKTKQRKADKAKQTRQSRQSTHKNGRVKVKMRVKVWWSVQSSVLANVQEPECEPEELAERPQERHGSLQCDSLLFVTLGHTRVIIRVRRHFRHQMLSYKMCLSERGAQNGYPSPRRRGEGRDYSMMSS